MGSEPEGRGRTLGSCHLPGEARVPALSRPQLSASRTWTGKVKRGPAPHNDWTFHPVLALTTCYRAAASGMRSLSLKWYPLACNEGGQICRNVYHARVPGSRALGTTRLTPQKEPGTSWGDGPHPPPNPHGHLNRDLSLARSSQHRHHQGLLC